MSVAQPRLQTKTLVLTAPQPQYGALQEHTVRAFVAPSAMTTTTFTHTQVGATLVGCLVIPEDGRAKGQERMVVSVSGTTATVDKAWSDVTNTTSIRAWLPGEVPWRATTLHASSIISSPHAAVTEEPDAFWNGHPFIGYSGANAGMSKTSGVFTSSTGTITLAANAAVAVGDLFLPRMVVRSAENVDATVKTKTQPRQVIGTGEQGADMAMIYGNEGNVKITVEQRPLATIGASTVQAAPPVELGWLMRDHFTQTLDTGGTVSAIDATSITTTGGVFSVNGAVLLHNGKVAQVLAVSGGGATISAYGTNQAGFANVSTGSVAYGGVTWTRKSSGNLHRVWDVYQGAKERMYLSGCMPTLSISLQRESAVKFMFDYKSSDPFQWTVDRPVAVGAAFPITPPDLGVPTSTQGMRCVIDGTTVTMLSIDFNTGLKPGDRPSLSGANQQDGIPMDYDAATGTLKIYADQNDIAGFVALRDRMLSGKLVHFLCQSRTAAGRTFWLASPAMQYTGADFSYEGTPAQGIFTMPFQCVSPELAVNELNVALFPAATYPGLKSFALGIV
jgi:hypothetical protein